MSNEVNDIDIENRTYYFFNDFIKIKNFDINNIKIDEKSYKNILVSDIGYATIKDLKYIKINSVNPSQLIFNKVNGYFEEIKRNKYLALVPEERWIKTTDLIRLITKNSDDYDEKYNLIQMTSYL